MNKTMLPIVGCALALLAVTTNAHARGASLGHISTGPVANGGLGSPGAPAASGFTALPMTGMGATDINSSHVHGYDMATIASVPASGGLQRNANGTVSHVGSASGSAEIDSGLLSQIQSKGIVPGVGNSLGSAGGLLGRGLGGNDKSNVNSIVRRLSKPGSTNGKHAGVGTAKPMATVLGSTRSPKTGEVCIWGAGTDGSCH